MTIKILPFCKLLSQFRASPSLWWIRPRPGRTWWRPTAASGPACRGRWRSAPPGTPGSRWSRLHWNQMSETHALQILTRLRRGKSFRKSSWTPPLTADHWDSLWGSLCTTPGSLHRRTLCWSSGRPAPRALICSSPENRTLKFPKEHWGTLKWIYSI